MPTIHATLAGALAALTVPLAGQQLDDAEVRIPYSELKRLLDGAAPAAVPEKPEPPEPALLSARLRLSIENGQPVIDATFRTLAFGDKVVLVPLIGGDVTLQSQGEENEVLLVENQQLCLASDKAGARTLRLRLLPLVTGDSFSITLPPCPSAIFETGELPEGRSVTLNAGNRGEALTSGQIRPLSANGNALTLRLLDDRETREALMPPEPSEWTWQHQALVVPSEGELIYQIIARASAAAGAGVQARLPMPPDARDIEVSGDDLVSHTEIRGENRSLALALTWKTRGILDRKLSISYRMPLRPLDTAWRLHAPGGDEETRTRFTIATSPFLDYAADGLSGPLTPKGLPEPLAETLAGATCRQLEAAAAADLTVTPVPVAATDEGVVKMADWTFRIEPDGAMLATGVLVIEHKGPLGLVLDVPDGMKLLSSELEGQPVSPVDLGGGRLKVTLPAREGISRFGCAFTRADEPLDPVEGTLALELPRTPLFIHALEWKIELPAIYQAETHGNLKRVPSPGGNHSLVALRKNLCRDERPETRLFYQRADINR
ncbi:MAG: hypothetical protein ACO3JG_08520 [Luteolibacter sp.]